MRAPSDRSGRSAWLKVVPGLTPDSIPQKYAQTVTSTWTTPIRCSFWGMKGVSTRPGPKPDILADNRSLQSSGHTDDSTGPSMLFSYRTGWIQQTMQGPSSKSLYILLGIAGALVGAKIADALEFYFLGFGSVIGAIFGAAFFLIGWRQLWPP